MAAIALTDVTKFYGDVAAVNGATLVVPDGAFCVLTGPSGCGKSTLLRLIAARERVTSGVIEIGDAVHQSYRAGRPELAELVDRSSFTPRRNLYDGMRAGLAERGLGKTDVEARVLQAADRLGLGHLMARTPGRASSGELARAAIGRLLAHQPAALLLDEPLAGLDPRRRLELRRAIRQAQRESGATAICATHDATDALALADLIAVMDEGRIVQAGPPDDIYARPASLTVAGLFGAQPMNLLPVRANQTGLSLEDGVHLGAASVMTGATFYWLGVRPEHLFVTSDDGPPPAARLPLAVAEVERAGHEIIVHGSVGPVPTTARIAATAVSPGTMLTLGARRAHLHLFHAETGERLREADGSAAEGRTSR